MTIDPSDLLLFNQVVAAGSFAGAARALGLSRQTVSERIARLEANLGVRLMERTTRSLGLTDAGATLFAGSAGIETQLEGVIHEVMGLQEAPTGRLRVSVPVIFGRLYGVQIAQDLRSRHPDLTVEMVLGDRRVHLIEEGFDAAIRVGPLDDSSMIGKKIGESRVDCVASPAFLAARGPITPAQLRTLPILGLRPEEVWDIDGAPLTLKPAVVLNDLGLVCDAAQAGLGVARLPEFLHRPATDAGALTVLFGAGAALQRDIFVIYPSRRYLAPKIRCFIHAVERHAAEVFPPVGPA